MDDRNQTLGAITLFVADRVVARDFYKLLFDADPIFEDESSAAFRLANMIVNLLVRSAAHELVRPAPVAHGDRGSAALMTIDSEDVDAAADELRRKGIELLNGPIDRPWGVRTIALADPDGHTWELAARIAT